MLWLAIFIPELPLHTALRHGAMAALHETPLAISDGSENRPFIRALNAAAAATGISEGMAVAHARARCNTLTVLPRNTLAEDHSLQALATIALAYTPMVCIEADRERHCVSLEMAASLRLFGGLRALLRQLSTALQEPERLQRFGRAYLGLAPTPLAAELFARMRAASMRPPACLPEQDIVAAVKSVPIALIPWLSAHRAMLHEIGLHTLGEVLALPREGFAKRFSATALLALDRCVARAPDPREPYALAEQFSAFFEFFLPQEEGPTLMHSVTQLFTQLADWLRCRAAGTRCFTLTFSLSRGQRCDYVLNTAASMREVKRWSILIVEHFQRRPLPSAAYAVALRCDAGEPLPEDSASLLPPIAQASETLHILIDRLHARLGAQAVYRLRVQADHRPERAWTAASMQGSLQKSEPLCQQVVRPTLLLTRPLALMLRDAGPAYQGALTLLTAPERIQSGWWDHAPVERDYFIARNPQGMMCWVFRALNESGEWYLHGVFA
jgi:protein ImuB